MKRMSGGSIAIKNGLIMVNTHNTPIMNIRNKQTKYGEALASIEMETKLKLDPKDFVFFFLLPFKIISSSFAFGDIECG